MYCVFHHISDHLQRQILFRQFYKKVGIRSDPPPRLGQNPKFVKGNKLGAPLKACYDPQTSHVDVQDYLPASNAKHMIRASNVRGKGEIMHRVC